MTPPDLDPATKARIEAEEAYRAQVRQRLKAGGAPPQRRPAPAAVAPVAPAGARQKMNPLLILVLILAGIWAALNLGQGLKKAELAAASVPPVGMTVQAQSTPDNYGLDLYVTLTSATGREIGTAGKVLIQIYDEPYGKPETVLRGEEFTVSASDFTKGTRGMGAFKQDAVFAHLGRMDTRVLGKSGDRVSVRASFTSTDGIKLSAKENASLP